MKSIILAVVALSVLSLASCGTFGVSSERPRSITNEHDWAQSAQRIERAKAEKAARGH